MSIQLAACEPCRKAHRKCDLGRPCTRCFENGFHCRDRSPRPNRRRKRKKTKEKLRPAPAAVQIYAPPSASERVAAACELLVAAAKQSPALASSQVTATAFGVSAGSHFAVVDLEAGEPVPAGGFSAQSHLIGASPALQDLLHLDPRVLHGSRPEVLPWHPLEEPMLSPVAGKPHERSTMPAWAVTCALRTPAGHMSARARAHVIYDAQGTPQLAYLVFDKLGDVEPAVAARPETPVHPHCVEEHDKEAQHGHHPMDIALDDWELSGDLDLSVSGSLDEVIDQWSRSPSPEAWASAPIDMPLAF